jgi:Cytosine specific DNA methyltransferase replication foci domain
VPQQNWEDKEVGPLYYTPHSYELPESAPDIAFLLGESDAILPFTAVNTEEAKPVRMLHDWAIFDARPSDAQDDGGALALALVSLQALDGASNGGSIRRAPEGAGAASPFFDNEEDAGQEDDGDYDDGGNIDGEDSEEGKPVSVRLRLGALLRYTIDYTKRDEYVLIPLWSEMMGFMCMRSCVRICSPIYLETTTAWYILGVPSPIYRPLYMPFFRAHKIAQVLVCALMRDAHTPLAAFLAEIQLTVCVDMGGSTNVLDTRDVKEAVRYGHNLCSS